EAAIPRQRLALVAGRHRLGVGQCAHLLPTPRPVHPTPRPVHEPAGTPRAAGRDSALLHAPVAQPVLAVLADRELGRPGLWPLQHRRVAAWDLRNRDQQPASPSGTLSDHDGPSLSSTASSWSQPSPASARVSARFPTSPPSHRRRAPKLSTYGRAFSFQSAVSATANSHPSRHTRTVSSSPTETTVLASALTATHTTSPTWPARVRRQSPVSRSHTRTVPSAPHEIVKRSSAQ